MQATKEPSEKAVPPQMELLEWTLYVIKAQALYVAAELGIADLLKNGARSASELAEATGADETFLYRLLRALAGWGVFQELEGRRFALNDKAECLRSDAEGSLRAWVQMRGRPWTWQPFGAIVDAVRSGRSGFRITMGEGPFDHFSKNPEASELFDQAMTSISGAKFEAVAGAYDFPAKGLVVDVGGGVGGQLMAVLRRNTGLQGMIADMPHVAAAARQRVEKAGFAERIRCEAIDMFQSVPQGGDVYLLGHILHDWDDQRCLAILRNCAAAMNEDGRVAVVEHLVPPPNTADQALAADLEMLVMTDGGRERTLEEYDQLFKGAGLHRSRVVETGLPWRVLEARQR